MGTSVLNCPECKRFIETFYRNPKRMKQIARYHKENKHGDQTDFRSYTEEREGMGDPRLWGHPR